MVWYNSACTPITCYLNSVLIVSSSGISTSNFLVYSIFISLIKTSKPTIFTLPHKIQSIFKFVNPPTSTVNMGDSCSCAKCSGCTTCDSCSCCSH
ncbi:hypothetical protein DL95DRAFT_392218 [Leptodontidium sp. 2 PMI_412]|nr:hypothetical protein DL95DRAFT_392218 [Leptodontidium sp. 2 PMI_412]